MKKYKVSYTVYYNNAFGVFELGKRSVIKQEEIEAETLREVREKIRAKYDYKVANISIEEVVNL